MRIIKLSDEKFKGIREVVEFFEDDGADDLRSKIPPGKFEIPKGKIAADRLNAGEKLLFTFEAIVRYIAITSSERQENQDNKRKKEYPYFFVIDMNTLRKVNSVDIRDIIGLNQQSWPIIMSHSETEEKIWERCERSIIPLKRLKVNGR